ncbi:MAG: hypothetical protein HYY25_10540 [Candidatus Wallbacteria bacterium]|nr:hypothetical protein [Candidatus Wallbacteria bacterium]
MQPFLLVSLAASSVLLAGGPLLAAPPPSPVPPPAAAWTPEEQNVLKGEELFRLAKEATRRRDYAAAATLLRQLTALAFPSDPSARELMAGAHLSLAEVLLVQQKVADAESTAKRGLGLTGTDAAPTFLRADVYELLAQISSIKNDTARAAQLRDSARRCRGLAQR